MKYAFYRGQTLLGVVIHETDDFPTHKGKFQPSANFKRVALLFEKEIYLLEYGDMHEWQKVRDEIDKLGTELRPLEGDMKTIVNPLIHIDGSEVWWS